MSEIPNNNMASPYALIPELGDLITIMSDSYGRTYGRIIYRDMAFIRIRPFTSSTSVVNFPLDPETGLFQETLGIKEVIIHEKRRDPHFAIQLAIVPGERLELFDDHARPLHPPVAVQEVIATNTYDAVRLEDGTMIDFQFIGPPQPIYVIRPLAAAEDELPPENESATANVTYEEEEEEFPDIELDPTLLPKALVEEVPSEERVYSDTVQREDMFVNLLADIPLKRQKDPRIMAQLYRTSDLLLALKNSVLPRDADKAPIRGAPSISYIPSTITDVISKQDQVPLPAVMPVAAIKKVLYFDDPAAEPNHEFRDIEIRSEADSLRKMKDAATAYEKVAGDVLGNPYVSYIQSVLASSAAFVPAASVAADGPKMVTDQDVLRSQVPPNPIDGFPVVPKAPEKDAPVDYMGGIGTITNSHVRLIGPTRFKNYRTGTDIVVAPGDTSAVVGNLLLSQKMTNYRSQIRSSVLLWDVQASESSRSRQTLFYNELVNDDITLLEPDMLLVDELNKRLIPALHYATKHTTRVLDSLGLRYLELSEQTFAPLQAKIREGLKTWDAAYDNLRKHALVAMAKQSQPAVPAIADASSPLLANTTGNELLKFMMEKIMEKETSMKLYDIAIANDIMKHMYGTLTPLWYAVAANVEPEYIAVAETVYKSEYGRYNRQITEERLKQSEFTATPNINPCAHVKELEKVFGIKNEQERMPIFQKFLTKYQGGQKGNMLLCSLCNNDLVCRHELLLLNEFLNPGRGVALHKTLLLEYAGPVFEGAYICKTCGQKIAEIEYDTHLEFDDEGRPLMGRGAIEQAGGEEDVDADGIPLRAIAEKEIPYVGAERDIYFNLRTVFERCGMVADDDTYKRAVYAARTYLERKVVKTEADYEKQRAIAAKKRIPLPPYATHVADLQIQAVGTVVLLELQTSKSHIPIPAPGCALSRDGFPLDGSDPATAGNGALRYVACAIAGIQILNAPWSKTSWSAETKMDKRIGTIETLLQSTVYSVLSMQNPNKPALVPAAPIDGVTDVYTERLQSTFKEKQAVATTEVVASAADILPPMFRPLSQIQLPSVAEEEPIGNRAQFQKNVEDGNVAKIGDLVHTRARQLSQKIMAGFHKQSAEYGIIIPNNPRSESVCCFKRLGAVALQGMGVAALDISDADKEESSLIMTAANKFHRRDPATSAGGTHILVPWSAPIRTTVLPEPNENDYYKLFLKHCYAGRSYGGVHEWGPDDTCRNCGFIMPRELLFSPGAEISETDGKRREAAYNALLQHREEIALQAFKDQGINITTETFRELEERIRLIKNVPAVSPVSVPPLLTRFESMISQLKHLLPAATADWNLFLVALRSIQEKGMKGLQRGRELSKFSTAYDARKTTFAGIMLKDVDRAPLADKINLAIATLESVSEQPHNIVKFIVTAAEQVSQHHAHVLSRKKIATWFPVIIPSHQELLLRIWETQSALSTRAIKAIEELDNEDVTSAIHTALQGFASWLGGWLRYWIDEIRVGVDLTADEHTLVLRWSVYSGCLALLTSSSSFFVAAPSEAVRATAINFIKGWLVDALTTAASRMDTYQKSPEEVRDELNARQEMEKEAVIKEFDDLDPQSRKMQLMMKKYGIGRWALGAVASKLNPEIMEAERAQRAQMGLPEFSADVTGIAAEGGGAEDQYGFYTFGAAEAVTMDAGEDHRAAQDEDE